MTEVVTLPAPRQADPNLPTTPRSWVIASAHMSPEPRPWEFHTDGRWHDTRGESRTPRQIRLVEVLRVAEPDDAPDGVA